MCNDEVKYTLITVMNKDEGRESSMFFAAGLNLRNIMVIHGPMNINPIQYTPLPPIFFGLAT